MTRRAPGRFSSTTLSNTPDPSCRATRRIRLLVQGDLSDASEPLPMNIREQVRKIVPKIPHRHIVIILPGHSLESTIRESWRRKRSGPFLGPEKNKIPREYSSIYILLFERDTACDLPRDIFSSSL